MRGGSLVRTALLATTALAAGCDSVRNVGGMNTCDDEGVVCDLDGGLSDAASPIGDPQYADYDRAANQRMSADLAGDWHGFATGLESISSPFDMHFDPLEGTTGGNFSVRCLELTVCVPFGNFNPDSRSSGQYDLTYVDKARTGRGEFTWEDDVQRSLAFSNLLLQQSDQVLSFVIDIPVIGSFQFRMLRGPFPDAGADVPVADAGGGSP
ncbi:MAG: hypothetical protein QM778_35690 [Myxococcales bacterium]